MAMDPNRYGLYDSVTVAKYVHAYAFDKGKELNATQLQKLLYITYGLLLAGRNRRACGESPQAWPYGPVFARTQKRFVGNIENARLQDAELAEVQQDAELTEAVQATISTFSGLSAGALSDWSHEDGSPWYRTKQQPGFKWGTEIPDEYIVDYFNQFIK